MNYNKLITEAQNNNIADMYDTFSHILADKVINSIDARRATIASSLLEDCGCEACHAKGAKSKKKRKISESQRFGGDTNIPASPKIKKYIESGKGIILDVPSSLHPTSRFAIYKNPAKGSGQDKVLMATISNPKRGRVKMFSFRGTHVSHQKAMDFAKKHKLVAMKDAKGNPLYAKESVELSEDNTAAVAKQVKQAVKKHTTGKLVVRSKGGKSRFIMVRADSIDNKLRKMMLDIVAPNANVRDKSNISYGNISSNMISASVDHWVKALRLRESVIPQLQKSNAFKMPVDINIDGNIIHVTPDISESLINLHDELNEENQTKMRAMLENSSSFVKLARFAQER